MGSYKEIGKMKESGKGKVKKIERKRKREGERRCGDGRVSVTSFWMMDKIA